MNIATTDRRYEVCKALNDAFGDERSSLCWEDYQKLAWNIAEKLCKAALDDGLVWSTSKDNKLFNMTLTSAYDSFSYRSIY